MVKQHEIFLRFSPNHNARPAEEIALIVLHYTGMQSEEEALEHLCSAQSKVSAHYFINEEGAIFQLVEEDRRAWHAGVGAWRGHENINDISIGIELVNPGHEWGYRPFPEAQIDALRSLCLDIITRYELPAHAVIGHSDLAPTRKQDPGELFPWGELASHGIGIWHDVAPQEDAPSAMELKDEHRTQLRALGYALDHENESSVIAAFQRHYRPEYMTGTWDEHCALCLHALMAKL